MSSFSVQETEKINPIPTNQREGFSQLVSYCTELRFTSFLSGELINVLVVNPPEIWQNAPLCIGRKLIGFLLRALKN